MSKVYLVVQHTADWEYITEEVVAAYRTELAAELKAEVLNSEEEDRRIEYIVRGQTVIDEE